MNPTSPMRGAMTIAIIELTLTTAYIHLNLGGVLFTLNAAGYAALAVTLAIVSLAPHPFVRRFEWAPRLGLAGYAVATILGYLVMGPYFSVGWVAKAVEIAILTLLVADLRLVYGSPAGLARAALSSVRLGQRRPGDI